MINDIIHIYSTNRVKSSWIFSSLLRICLAEKLDTFHLLTNKVTNRGFHWTYGSKYIFWKFSTNIFGQFINDVTLKSSLPPLCYIYLFVWNCHTASDHLHPLIHCSHLWTTPLKIRKFIKNVTTLSSCKSLQCSSPDVTVSIFYLFFPQQTN